MLPAGSLVYRGNTLYEYFDVKTETRVQVSRASRYSLVCRPMRPLMSALFVEGQVMRNLEIFRIPSQEVNTSGGCSSSHLGRNKRRAPVPTGSGQRLLSPFMGPGKSRIRCKMGKSYPRNHWSCGNCAPPPRGLDCKGIRDGASGSTSSSRWLLR